MDSLGYWLREFQHRDHSPRHRAGCLEILYVTCAPDSNRCTCAAVASLFTARRNGI